MTIATFNIPTGSSTIAYMSYATVAEADQALRLETQLWATWSALDVSEKQVHLAGATRQIDMCDFIGVKAAADQDLKWPRVADRGDPTANPAVPVTLLVVDGEDLPADAIPEGIVHATAYLAAITHQKVTNQTGERDKDIKKLVGDREEIEYFEPHLLEPDDDNGLPITVMALLAMLLAYDTEDEVTSSAVCTYDRDFFPDPQTRDLNNEERWSW